LNIREEIAQKYESSLKNSKIKFPKVLKGTVHSRHLFPIHVGPDTRDKALQTLGEFNIGVTVNYRSIHTLNFYSNKYRIDKSAFPVSLNWGEGTLCIPLFPGIKTEEQEYVIDVLVNKIDKMIGAN
jgi:dTDP-4-amino-4,6-dideoxygalactose transaminase